MAAVLAYGPDAALSNRSAAALRDLGPDNRLVSDVSLPRRSVRSRPGIIAHAAPSLTSADLSQHDGIPCTSVARTLLDLAATVDRRGLERAIARAEMLRLFDLREVEELLARANGHRGAGVFAAVLAGWADHGSPRRAWRSASSVPATLRGFPGLPLTPGLCFLTGR